MAQIILFTLDRGGEIDAMPVSKVREARLRWTRRGSFCDIVEVLEDGVNIGNKVHADPRFAAVLVKGLKASAFKERLAPDMVTVDGPEGPEQVAVQRRRWRFDVSTLPLRERQEILKGGRVLLTDIQFRDAMSVRPRLIK